MPRPPLTRSAATARATAASVRSPRSRVLRAGAQYAGAPAFVALCVLALCGVTLSGAVASVAAARQAGGVPVSLAITSVSPDYASPGKPVTVAGTVTNNSDSQLGGLSISLRSSEFPFYSRTALDEYASGTTQNDTWLGVSTDLKPLAPQATVTWKVTLPASQLPMRVFGVYPLAAEVDGALGPITVSRTFLPFWPGTKSLDPQRQDVAWIWPLIDQPRQGRCLGLLNNGLAASFGSGGRLAGLLQAGRSYTQSAQLTWAIDPAVLANAATMSRAYAVGGVAGCHGSPRPGGPDSLRGEQASQPARAWLTGVESATAGQQVFVTPYDDADIAALTRYNLYDDLDRAFAEGRLLARHTIGRDFTSTAGGTAADAYGIAWLADGGENRADLAHLAASDKISTVVLDSRTMPPSPPQNFTPSAQTTMPDRTASGMSVLLSDDTITELIGSAGATSDAATTFSVEQRFLAETAMIAAERPGWARSIVIAPPREWDPPAGLASGLLSETVHAPWLRPVSLASLAAVKHPAGQVTRQRPPMTVSGAQLSQSLVTQVRQLDQQAQVLESIQVAPSPSPVSGLDRAMFAIESSAWRAPGGRAGQQALADQVSGQLTSEEHKLKIVVTAREQLTGKTGTVPVTLANRLPYPVRVRLAADPGGGVTVKKQPRTMTLHADEQIIVPLQVTASGVGSTNLTLSLLTPDGTPIPDVRASMTIQATHYGTLALVIIAGVLGVFMISSGIRTFRRRGRRGRDASSSDPPGASPEPGDAAPASPDASPVARDAAAGWPERRDRREEADTVVSDRIKTRRAGPRHASTGRDLAEREETDDYAWTPGWTDRR
jgi:hypothetical protein